MKHPHHGFSLVEVVIALGVVGFALIAILGLFPMAMTASKDSQNETRAAFIAQLILSHIQTQNPTNASFPLGLDPAATSALNGNAPLRLTNSSTFYAIYDADGQPYWSSDANKFDQGVKTGLPTALLARAAYQARLRVQANQPTNGLSRLVVDVVYPATAPAASRQTNSFITVRRNQP